MRTHSIVCAACLALGLWFGAGATPARALSCAEYAWTFELLEATRDGDPAEGALRWKEQIVVRESSGLVTIEEGRAAIDVGGDQ